MAKPKCQYEIKAASADVLTLVCSGSWTIAAERPTPTNVIAELVSSPPAQRITFDISGLERWDSSFVALVFLLDRALQEQGRTLEQDQLPEGVKRLLALATAVEEQNDNGSDKQPGGWLERVGHTAIRTGSALHTFFAFLGELFTAFRRLLTGQARLPLADMAAILQSCGPAALPIVSLLSMLIGMTMAYIGAIQLEKFGAAIYVANLVTVIVLREMASVMTGVIMAGRTGAAFAAQLGTMQTNEEIDALKTMGLNPLEFLVLPRVLALALMMPLLCLYANLVGILGGMFVAVTSLDISAQLYWEQTRSAAELGSFLIGIGKGFVFALLIGILSCYQGLSCRRSAAGVGQAVTAAVVSGIVAIVVADSFFAIVCNILGI